MTVKHRPRRQGRQAQLLDLRARDRRDAADRRQAHPRRGVLDVRRRAAEARRRARGDDPDRPVRHRRSIPSTRKHYVAIAVGSGITPILSILQTTLEIETESRFTLIYGNRTKRVDDVPATSSTSSSPATPTGSRSCTSSPATRSTHRSSAAGSTATSSSGWLSGALAPETVDEWFLCGPLELVRRSRETLLDHSVDPEHIHLELFYGYDTTTAPSHNYTRRRPSPCAWPAPQQTVELSPGDTILEAALQARADTPYACMGGACGTCRAKLLAGHRRDGPQLRAQPSRPRRRLRAHLPIAPHHPERDRRLRRLRSQAARDTAPGLQGAPPHAPGHQRRAARPVLCGGVRH